MTDEDILHCVAREAQERAASAAATDPGARRAHDGLADLYAERVSQAREDRDLAGAQG